MGTCDTPGSTHWSGCDCHEALRNAEIATLRAEVARLRGGAGARRARRERDETRAAIALYDAERAAERECARLLVAVFDRLDDGPGESGPTHGHVVPGVWDEINGPPVGGQPCEWCATWRRVREAIRALGTVPGAGEGQQ